MQSSTLYHTPISCFWPLLQDPIACAKYQPLLLQPTYHCINMKKLSLAFSICGSSTIRLQCLRAYPATIDIGGLSHVGIDSDPSFLSNLHLQQDKDEQQAEDHNHFSCSEVTGQSPQNIKETQRRIKIGLANKGRIPWNKGRKHTAETRAKIKQRTLEAIRNPKVKSC